MMAFNSPVWFNCGVEAKPQCSACFINSVDDTMGSILELAKTEGMLFKWGSGTGSNLSPTSPKISDRAREIIGRLGPSEGQLVPADLVLASGGGMDPHITLAAAKFQVSRVATARNLTVEQVQALVNQHADSPTLVALGGEPLVNVLKLNLALDEMAH